jgi:hypothetical protein
MPVAKEQGILFPSFRDRIQALAEAAPLVAAKAAS